MRYLMQKRTRSSWPHVFLGAGALDSLDAVALEVRPDVSLFVASSWITQEPILHHLGHPFAFCAHKVSPRLRPTGPPNRMSHRKWRSTKQHPSRARAGYQISCCLLSPLFLCDVLSGGPVHFFDISTDYEEYEESKAGISIRISTSTFQNVLRIERISFSIFRPTSFDLGSCTRARARGPYPRKSGSFVITPPPPHHVGLKTRP